MEPEKKPKKEKKDKKEKLNKQFAEEFETKKAAFSSGGNETELLKTLLNNPPLKADDLDLKVRLITPVRDI